jgi:hypothetical protein
MIDDDKVGGDDDDDDDDDDCNDDGDVSGWTSLSIFLLVVA